MLYKAVIHESGATDRQCIHPQTAMALYRRRVRLDDETVILFINQDTFAVVGQEKDDGPFRDLSERNVDDLVADSKEAIRANQAEAGR